jgi:primosomal protein N' (replication factor Y)
LTDTEPSCVRIALALPVRETFDYAVPDHLASRARIGARALVPFRNQKATGYILEGVQAGRVKEIREILDILDREPLFHEGLVPFFQWMADYYLYPIGRLIQAALPGGLNVSPFKTGRVTEKGMAGLTRLPARSAERRYLARVKENPNKRLPSPLHMAYSLEKQGLLTIEKKSGKRRAGPLMKKFIRAKEGVDLSSLLREGGGEIRAAGEAEFLEAVLNSGGILLKDLSSRFSNGPYLAGKWIRKGVLEGYSAPVFRGLTGNVLLPSPVPPYLYDQQKGVLEVIGKRLGRGGFSTCLLHGVTGSGKTEVYYRAIEHAIRLGRQSILMVPEIALAVYMEGLFRTRLGERVAVFHSGLGEGERYDQWIRMARGDVDLVIGARSALFAPLPRLGLIIVDEEHDFSYKQEEGPRYQARDAAVVRGKMERALVILGSGTPSIQSFHNARTGRYRLLSMPERIEERPLPRVEIIDMKTVKEEGQRNGIISPPLKEALHSHLARGSQVILFLNRRGFHRVYLCRFCGQSVRCHNCDLALIHHLGENRLACHYCGFSAQPQQVCPSCKREGMKAYGFGTERLEHELQEMFPELRVARMDRDSTRRKGETFRLLKSFNDHQVDILVGTQMITKGYDFPNVTLVGVIAADFSLGFPDFRASERTFQILSQVAGRAGRGEQIGKVIVQTFNPEHYAIIAAKDHDYSSFFQREMGLREQLGYPPFSFLACLRLQGNTQKETTHTAGRLGHEMVNILGRWPKRGKEIQVLGPAEAPMAKLKGKYRWQILVKSKGAGLLHYYLKEVEGRTRNLFRSSNVNLVMDVDPYQML